MNCRKCGNDISNVAVKSVNTKYGLKRVVNCPFCVDGKFPTSNWLKDEKQVVQVQEPKTIVSAGDAKMGLLRDILTNTKVILTQLDAIHKNTMPKEKWGEEEGEL